MSTDSPKLKPMWGNRSIIGAPVSVITDTWARKELVRNLIKRDLDTRYREPWLGYSWAVIEPTLLAIAYTFAFMILRGKSDPSYAIVVLIGVIGYQLFVKSYQDAVNTLSKNVNLFQFTRIPKALFSVSSMLTNFVLALISLLALIPWFFILDLEFQPELILIPLWLLFIGFSGWSLGVWLAPLALRIPDILKLTQFITKIGFFLSPVMWTYEMLTSLVGDGPISILLHLNPVLVPITEMRDIILGTSSDVPLWGYVLCWVLPMIFYLFGTMYFEAKAHKAVVAA